MPRVRRAAGPRPATLCRALPLAFAIALFQGGSSAFADAYDAPASYYAPATATDVAVKSQLYNVIKTMTSREYGDARYAAELLDRDPANPNNILLIYNRASVDGTWDNDNLPWNREHIWPASLLGQSSPSNSYNGAASDMFELRPANVQINNTRGNSPFGRWDVAPPVTGHGVVPGDFYHPGPADRGDVARTLFYMATRYGEGQGSANLTLVDGHTTTTYKMGDKQSLLRWHYSDPVDDFERRRNHLIYSSADNPQYFQGNRNPYIDRPEYVWAAFGGGANNSQISLTGTGAVAGVNGASTAVVDLGKVISGSAFGTRSLTLNKTGSNPTTFNATASSGITSTIDDPRQTFNYDAGSKPITLGLSGSTATPGPRGGSLTIDNTDVSSGGSGQGFADGNDVVNVSGLVVSHAAPSFALAAPQAGQTIDFDVVAQGSTAAAGFSVFNRIAASGYTAGLDLDSVGAFADAAFSSTLGTRAALVAGVATPFVANVSGTTLGLHAGTITITTSDENIPGATALANLTLTLTARVAVGGDATLDNVVGFDDLLALAQNYGNAAATWVTGDFNRTATSDFDDLLVLAQNYGYGALTSGDLTSASFAPDFAADWALARSLVPEPTTLAVLVGIVPVMARRRRR